MKSRSQLGRQTTASFDVDRAIETFVRGFCFTRSFTHPYLAKRVGRSSLMRDGPRKQGAYRTEEWVSCSVPPKNVDRMVRKRTRGRFVVCAVNGIDESDELLRSGFKALGYRLRGTEPLMVHHLRRSLRCKAAAKIERVTTTEMVDRLAKAARSRQILHDHLSNDSPMRAYVALIDDKPVGWVGSIAVGDSTWCSNMFVVPAFRRRGIARALMSRMLRDDRNSGATAAVLLASHAGAKLYPIVGYEQIGTLLLYMPKKQ
jgi:predicted N-acetyltransferase YhbS